MMVFEELEKRYISANLAVENFKLNAEPFMANANYKS